MDAAVSTTYEPFSDEPEYIEANRAFIQSLDLSAVGRLADLACGTGVMSDLALESRPGMQVLGLDLAREQLLLARDRFTEKGLFDPHASPSAGRERPALLWVEGSADVLPFAGSAMDAVIMGHSIHNLPDPDRLLSEIRRILRPGGLFAFNSAFYAGTYVPGTEKFYQIWVREALGLVMRRDRELREQGLPGVKRTRGTFRRAFSKRWPSVDEWRDTLGRNGFEVTKVNERTVEMTQQNFEAVGSYAGFACALLSGYPPQIACEAVKGAVAPALAEAGFTKVPQGWLEVTATRIAGSNGGRG